MSEIASPGAGIARKSVPYKRLSAPYDDYRTVEQIPMESWTRQNQHDPVSPITPSQSQPMTGLGHRKGQSEAAEGDLGFEFTDLNLRAPSYDSEHVEMQNSLTEVAISSETLMFANSIIDHDAAYEKTETGWTPLYLRRVTLIVFIIVFIAMLITLAALYSHSEHNQGLSTIHENLHYLWTYGPTAILTLVFAFWGQVEFRTTQLIPWKAMAMGPQPARSSVLLDYLSPWNVLVLFQSLRNRHWVVSIAVLGAILLKLMTVFSTGLFALQFVLVSNPNTPLVATDRFDGSNYNAKFVDARPMYAAYGVQLLNMSYPPGTTSQYAVQSFNASTPSNSTLIGVVDAFAPDLACEIGELTVQNVATLACQPHACPQFNVSVTTPSCHAAGILFLGPQYNAFGGPENSVTAYSGNLQPATCMDMSPGDDPNRMVLSMQRLRYHGADNPEFQVVQSINLVCKPTYAIRRALVSAYIDMSNGSHWDVGTPSGPENNQLQHISGWDVANGVLSSIQSVEYVGWQTQGRGSELGWYVDWLQNTTQTIRFDTFFTILAGQMSGVAAFFDADALNTTSRHAYVSMAAQVAKRFLTVPAQDPFTGTSFANENRLFMRAISFGLMEAFLVVLIIIAILLYFYAPRRVITRDPGSIAGLATVLKQSPDFVRSVQDIGASGMGVISNRIKGYRYSTVTGMRGDQPHFAIKTSLPKSFEDQANNLQPSPDLDLRWWQPLSLTLPARFLALAIPIALIVALELLYQLSQRHNGLVDVDPDGYSHYTWTYIPAAVMLSVGILFRMVDFNTRVYQPYHALRRGAASASSSILENHLGKIALQEFWSASLKRQYAVVATTLAMLLAPILTIAVSGLYTAGGYESPVTVQQLTYFNFSSAKGGGELMVSPSLPVLNLLLDGNLSYPQWTFNELVLPQIKIDAAKSPGNDTLMSLNTQVPAVRAALSCIENGRSLISAAFSKSDDYNNLALNFSTPDGCGNNYTNGDLDAPDIGTAYMDLPSTGGYFGKLFESILSGGGDTVNKTICPSKLAVWGVSSTTGILDLTTAKCYENIEQVSANVTFQLPTYAISPSLPPQPLESTAINMTHFPVIIDNDVTDFLTPLNHSGELLDGFFSALVHGNDPVPISYFANNLKFAEITTVIEKLYSIVAGQSINIRYRTSLNGSTDLSAVNPADKRILTGTLYNPSPVRLRQNAISTRILEGLLAAMFLCAAISFVLMDTRRVLPKNPCSIAAVASLLAGSDILSKGVIPHGAELCDDAELQRRGVFDGYLFSMGWWGDKDEETRRFGIDIGMAEAESGLTFRGLKGSKRKRESS